MNSLGSKHTNRPMAKVQSDSIEKEKPRTVGGTIASFGGDTLKKTGEGIAEIGKGIFEQLLGNYSSEKSHEQYKEPAHEEEPQPAVRPEGGTLFSFREQEEQQQMNELKELIKQIKQEIDAIKQANKAMIAEVKDIEKITMESMPEKAGIYHIRVLEIFLKILHQIRLKIGESNTWLEAMTTKRAKRGSLFAARSKKQGTQYSMSQELSNARSVQ